MRRRDFIKAAPALLLVSCAMARQSTATRPAPAGAIRMRLDFFVRSLRWASAQDLVAANVDRANRVWHAADIEWLFGTWEIDTGSAPDVDSITKWLSVTTSASRHAKVNHGVYIALVESISWPSHAAGSATLPTDPAQWGVALAYPGGSYILAHELGHVLGLKHSDDTQNVMNIHRDHGLLPHLNEMQIECARAWALSSVRRQAVIQ